VEFDKQLRTLTRGLQPPGAPRRKSLWG
jgi:hypothetical protein